MASKSLFDPESIGTENFVSSNFEERFILYAQKFGFAGAELETLTKTTDEDLGLKTFEEMFPHLLLRRDTIREMPSRERGINEADAKEQKSTTTTENATTGQTNVPFNFEQVAYKEMHSHYYRQKDKYRTDANFGVDAMFKFTIACASYPIPGIS